MKKCNKREKKKNPQWGHAASKNEIELIHACKLIRNVYASKLRYGGYNQKSPDIRSVIRIISKQLINLKATFINQLGRPYTGIDLLEALVVVANFYNKKKLREMAKKAVGSVRVVKQGLNLIYLSR